MTIFERPLKVGKIDNFKLTLSKSYLDGEVITGATVTSPSPNLTVDSVSDNGVTISAVCTGVIAGEAELHFDWTTGTRSGCEGYIVIVLDC